MQLYLIDGRRWNLGVVLEECLDEAGLNRL